MNKLFALTNRNLKEVVRNPLAAVFCIGFPVVMLILMQLLFGEVEGVPQIFEIKSYSVGICVFGYTFVTLFVTLAIAGDKNTEFINRINIAPVKKSTYLASHFLAMLPITLIQTVLFFGIAICFGLEVSWNILLAICYLLPSAIFYITLGVLLGCLAKNEKQSGPLASIFVTLVSMLGGVFMPINEMGTFSTIANLLPFSHSIQIASGVFAGNLGSIFPHIFWVAGYTIVVAVLAVLVYKQKK